VTPEVRIPSWLRWPPNCCETCTGWKADSKDRWIGTCNSDESLEMTSRTDARFRCPSFQRRDGL